MKLKRFKWTKCVIIHNYIFLFFLMFYADLCVYSSCRESELRGYAKLEHKDCLTSCCPNHQMKFGTMYILYNILAKFQSELTNYSKNCRLNK